MHLTVQYIQFYNQILQPTLNNRQVSMPITKAVYYRIIIHISLCVMNAKCTVVLKF